MVGFLRKNINLETPLLLISDTHGSLSYASKKRAILRAQDIGAVICMGDVYLDELMELKKMFDKRHVPIYGIPGNHEPESYIEDAGLINIHGKSNRICGVSVAGFGGCIRYKNNTDICLMTEEESIRLAMDLPKADILVSHSPYRMDMEGTAHSGLSGISWYIDRCKPAFHFHGHLHSHQAFTHKNGTRSVCIYQAAVLEKNKNQIRNLF